MNKTLEKIDKEIKKIEDDEEREAAQARLLEIHRVYEGDDEVLTWPELLIDAKGGPTSQSTGWSSLDGFLRGGFRPQQLISVSALTGSGKTSFVVDLTARMIHLKPLWLTFEESVEELSEKFSVDRQEQVPDFFSPKSVVPYNLQWVEDKVIEGIAKHGSRVVVVDHLDYIVPYNAERPDLRIAEAMRFLKGLARKWNIVVILICHLVKAKMETQPTLDDIRGSAAIGQESDTVILLWREVKRNSGQVEVTNNVNVSIQKARRGKPGNVKMVFRNGRFLEEDWMLSKADEEFDKF